MFAVVTIVDAQFKSPTGGGGVILIVIILVIIIIIAVVLKKRSVRYYSFVYTATPLLCVLK